MEPLTSVQDLIQYATRRYFTEPRGRWIFRGHSKAEYDLVPSVGRYKHTAKSRQRYEKGLFDIFRREALAYIAPGPDNDWEWLSLAQHHGDTNAHARLDLQSTSGVVFRDTRQ